jgi:acyl transferase domain-containing protein
MGRGLITQSEYMRSFVEEYDRILTLLPPSDCPSWSIRDELLADAPTPQVNEAEISQPSCTGIQIILADLLRSAGTSLTAVVAHSSAATAEPPGAQNKRKR